jgi:hypothetical protein
MDGKGGVAVMLRISSAIRLVLLVCFSAIAHSAEAEAVGQNMRLQFHVEMFNAFNNVNYGQPNAIFGSGTFGRISATSLTYPNMRPMQLRLKLIF